MGRPPWGNVLLVAAVGAIAAVVHSVALPVVAGAQTGFLTWAVVVSGGIGLLGSGVGFVAAQLLRQSSMVSLLTLAVVTFLVTLGLSSLPGLLGGIGRALFVTIAVAIVYALVERRAVRQVRVRSNQ